MFLFKNQNFKLLIVQGFSSYYSKTIKSDFSYEPVAIIHIRLSDFFFSQSAWLMYSHLHEALPSKKKVILSFINKSQVSKIWKVIFPYSVLAFRIQCGFSSVLLKPEKSNSGRLEVRKMQPMRKRLKKMVMFE